MAPRLFGTDGVRGRAGSFLTGELAASLGDAVVRAVSPGRPRLLVIRDTRESGPGLAAAIARGAEGAGADVVLGGVLPTPVAPLLVAGGEFDLGAVVSASHNPYEDNGIKFFGPGGFKLSDEQEREIESLVASGDARRPSAAGAISERDGLGRDYVEALATRFAALDLAGLAIALDCANGATYEVAAAIFERLGARVTLLGHQPDGRNINAGCGSTDIGHLSALLARGGHDLGFAFDGDGDRVIAVDGDGAALDGDELIAIIARALKRRGELTGGGVAVTVMSNHGFGLAMEADGITVARTGVGDRHVLAELRARGWRIGGEQSGHIIDMDFVPSGDGIASALLVLDALGGQRLRAGEAFARLPQRLVNVAVADRDAALEDAAITEAIAAETAALGDRGRVLVRPSGTEQLVRVMVEAGSEGEAAAVCERLAARIGEREATRTP